MTSAPRRAAWFITRPIAFSLPGITRADSTTTSPGSSLTCRWSSIAIRGSAASGSPASEELWRATLRLAAHFGTTADVTNVAGQMYAALTRHGGPRGPEAETDALVDELLPGYHRPAQVA